MRGQGRGMWSHFVYYLPITGDCCISWEADIVILVTAVLSRLLSRSSIDIFAKEVLYRLVGGCSAPSLCSQHLHSTNAFLTNPAQVAHAGSPPLTDAEHWLLQILASGPRSTGRLHGAGGNNQFGGSISFCSNTVVPSHRRCLHHVATDAQWFLGIPIFSLGLGMWCALWNHADGGDYLGITLEVHCCTTKSVSLPSFHPGVSGWGVAVVPSLPAFDLKLEVNSTPLDSDSSKW